MKNLLKKLVLNSDLIFDNFLDKIKNDKSFLLTYFNQHCFNIAYDNMSYRKILENNFIVYQEGIGIYLLLKYLCYKELARVNATIVNKNLIRYIVENRLSVYLIGGNFTEDFIKQECKKRNMKLIGYRSGYFENEKLTEILEEIKEAKPEVIIIGMGVPKQEFVAIEIEKRIKGVKIICVGNFLNYYFDLQKEAPLFIRKLELEWLYRVYLEPKRLFKRYFLGIPLFFYRAFVKLRL